MSPRIRTIKPDFFRHFDLYQAEIETGLPLRVAYPGLWTVADREGRFRWRPENLKLDILPFDDLDFSRVLDALVTRGFIVKYVHSGKQYGLIPTFKNHQFINNKENPSILPAPPDEAEIMEDSTRDSRVVDACPTRLYAKEGEWEGEKERDIGMSIDILASDRCESPPSPADNPVKLKPKKCPHEMVVETYHRVCVGFPRVEVWRGGRKYLDARWRESPERQCVEFWEHFFARVHQSNYLSGKVNGFKATLNWLVKPENFEKVMNGTYDNRKERLVSRTYDHNAAVMDAFVRGEDGC